VNGGGGHGVGERVGGDHNEAEHLNDDKVANIVTISYNIHDSIVILPIHKIKLQIFQVLQPDSLFNIFPKCISLNCPPFYSCFTLPDQTP